MEHLAKHPGEKFKNIIKQQVQLPGASDKRRQLTKFKDVNASLKLVLSSRSDVHAFILCLKIAFTLNHPEKSSKSKRFLFVQKINPLVNHFTSGKLHLR